jgi:hypothetical protein
VHNRRVRYFLAALLAVIIMGLGILLTMRRSSTAQPQSQSADSSRLLTSFTENGVHVEIHLEKDNNGLSLVATYRPTNARFHLYSKDLPPGGLNGLGRPTVLEISGNGVESAGALLASVPTIKLNATWSPEPVPVYPEGPVTLRLPIRFLLDATSPIPAELSLTYMTCSDAICLPPVEGKIIPIQLPALNG